MKLASLLIKITPELHAKLKSMAAMKQMGLYQLIVEILTDYVEDGEK